MGGAPDSSIRRAAFTTTALVALLSWDPTSGSAIAQSGAGRHTPSSDELSGLGLRSIGPAVMGGRIDDIAVVEERPWIFYVGTASGGLWKTSNAGTTWQALFDDEPTAPNFSIGDVTLAPSDPEVVWVGTGEPNNRQSSSFGNGVYRSIDGGQSWQHLGLADTHHIGRIVVHPLDPNTAWVAALGHLWGPNEERGVFRTRDGGRSWEKVLYVDADTGVVDIAIDPANSSILYAGAYQRRRTPWGFSGGGEADSSRASTAVIAGCASPTRLSIMDCPQARSAESAST